MTTATVPRLMTADDLLAMPDDGMRCELVNGELTELPPPEFTHGEIQLNAGAILRQFVRPRGLGRVTTDAGYRISADPDTVRSPDAAFVSARRLRNVGRPRGYLPFAPDIAVEVVSRSDTPSAARARALMWLEAGSALVWMLFPDSRSATVYRADGDFFTLGENDVLDAAPVLDGFSVKVSEFFDMFG